MIAHASGDLSGHKIRASSLSGMPAVWPATTQNLSTGGSGVAKLRPHPAKLSISNGAQYQTNTEQGSILG
jgi:hypothetical protein